MRKIKYAISDIFFYSILVLFCFLSENIALFEANRFKGLSDGLFLFLSAALISMLVFYFLFEKIKNKIKIDWALTSLLGIIAIMSIVSIWTTPSCIELNSSINDSQLVLEISTFEKLKGTFLTVIGLSVFYSTYYIFGKKVISSKRISYAYNIVGFTTFFLGLSCFFLERDVVFNFFSSTPTHGIESIFGNENTLALALLLGILSMMISNYNKHHWWQHLVIVFNFIFIIFTTSVICLTISFIAIVLFYLFKFFNSLKKHWLRNLIILKIFFRIIILVLLAFILLAIFNGSAIIKIFNVFYSKVSYINFFTASNRTYIWSGILKYSMRDVYHSIFGLGYHITPFIVAGITNLKTGGEAIKMTCHNGFVEIIATGGLFALSFYIFIIGYFYYCCIRLAIKKEWKYSLLFAFCFTAVLARSLLESLSFFGLQSGYFLVNILFVLPVTTRWKIMKSTKNMESIVELVDVPETYTFNKTLKRLDIFKHLFIMMALFIPVSIATLNIEIIGVNFLAIEFVLCIFLTINLFGNICEKNKGGSIHYLNLLWMILAPIIPLLIAVYFLNCHWFFLVFTFITLYLINIFITFGFYRIFRKIKFRNDFCYCFKKLFHFGDLLTIGIFLTIVVIVSIFTGIFKFTYSVLCVIYFLLGTIYLLIAVLNFLNKKSVKAFNNSMCESIEKYRKFNN